jgi:hypothetical protein
LSKEVARAKQEDCRETAEYDEAAVQPSHADSFKGVRISLMPATDFAQRDEFLLSNRGLPRTDVRIIGANERPGGAIPI